MSLQVKGGVEVHALPAWCFSSDLKAVVAQVGKHFDPSNIENCLTCSSMTMNVITIKGNMPPGYP